MRGFLIALQFLTILPIKIKSEIKEKDFGKSLLYFPIVGILIGLALSLTAFLFGFLSNLIAGIFVLIISLIITGGIHLDGFADTCDGFYQSKPKEKILEIMRDSRVGVMGVIGIVCLLLLKFILIVSIPREILWKSLIMMAVFARWGQVLACYTSDYAREEGKAKYFIEYAGKREFLAGSFLTMALFLLLMELEGVILLILSFLPIFLFINYVKRRIGGMTGDTIGATSEIAEIVVLFFTVIHLVSVNV
jgi:adenosylcobinamide-GDP ribazoletransferase